MPDHSKEIEETPLQVANECYVRFLEANELIPLTTFIADAIQSERIKRDMARHSLEEAMEALRLVTQERDIEIKRAREAEAKLHFLKEALKVVE